MSEERIKEVFSDEAFVKELLSKETAEEVQKMLADKDIDLSIEEILKLREMLLKKVAQGNPGEEELADDDLEDVAGGIFPVLVAFVFSGLAVFGGCLVLDAKLQDRW